MKRGPKILILAIILLAAPVIDPLVHHYQLCWAMEAYISQLKANGQQLDLAEVLPAPVPAGQNGAPLITNALAEIYLEPNYTNSIMFNNAPEGMNRSIPGKEMAGWYLPVIHGPETWPADLTNTWEQLGAQLGQRRNDLGDFRKLIERPVLDFHPDYSDIRAPGIMGYLPKLKLAGEWLEASESFKLHENRTAEACEDVRAMLAFVKGETQERYEITQLIRMALARMAAAGTWEILQTTNVTDEDLAQLQQDWQSLQFIEPLKNTYLFERVNDMRLLDALRQSPTNLSWWSTAFFGERGYVYDRVGLGASARWVFVDKSPPFKKLLNHIVIPWDEARWRWFWSYQDEHQDLLAWNVMLDGITELETNRSFSAVQASVNTNFARVNVKSEKENPFIMASENTVSQLGSLRRAAAAEVAKNVVVAAIAIKRYEIRHHQSPDALVQMAPDFLPSVPIDYMDGRPLRYRPNADGTFLLYSVGNNGKDDGGNPAWEKTDVTSFYYDWQSPHALDWVWPRPAKPEEIRAFFAQQNRQVQ